MISTIEPDLLHSFPLDPHSNLYHSRTDRGNYTSNDRKYQEIARIIRVEWIWVQKMKEFYDTLNMTEECWALCIRLYWKIMASEQIKVNVQSESNIQSKITLGSFNRFQVFNFNNRYMMFDKHYCKLSVHPFHINSQQ